MVGMTCESLRELLAGALARFFPADAPERSGDALKWLVNGMASLKDSVRSWSSDAALKLDSVRRVLKSISGCCQSQGCSSGMCGYTDDGGEQCLTDLAMDGAVKGAMSTLLAVRSAFVAQLTAYFIAHAEAAATILLDFAWVLLVALL